MPTFVCDRCHSIDNTALTLYSVKRKMSKYFGDAVKDGECLCSACIPSHYASGEPCKKSGWHNRFLREIGTTEWAIEQVQIGNAKETQGMRDLVNGIKPLVEASAPKVGETKRAFRSLID